jgi:hypothetical protein
MVPTIEQAQAHLRKINSNHAEREEARKLAEQIRHLLAVVVSRSTVESITRAAVADAADDATVLEALQELHEAVSESELMLDANTHVFAIAEGAERKRLQPQLKACEHRLAAIEDEFKAAHAVVVQNENRAAEPLRRWNELMGRGLLHREIEQQLGIPCPTPKPEAERAAEKSQWYQERDRIWAGLQAERTVISRFKKYLDESLLPASVLALVEKNP